jgi:hypothetical protein
VVLERCGAFVRRNLATATRPDDVANRPSCSGLLSPGDKAENMRGLATLDKPSADVDHEQCRTARSRTYVLVIALVMALLQRVTRPRKSIEINTG